MFNLFFEYILLLVCIKSSWHNTNVKICIIFWLVKRLAIWLLFICIIFSHIWIKNQVRFLTILYLISKHYHIISNNLESYYFNIKALSNTLVMFHPPLVAVTIFYLHFYMFLNQKLQKLLTLRFFFITVFSSYLGSLWSQQELFWDGFWNWDGVELIIFVISFLLYINSHTFFIKLKFFIFILLILLFNKVEAYLNSSESVHSFVPIPLKFIPICLSQFIVFWALANLYVSFKILSTSLVTLYLYMYIPANVFNQGYGMVHTRRNFLISLGFCYFIPSIKLYFIWVRLFKFTSIWICRHIYFILIVQEYLYFFFKTTFNSQLWMLSERPYLNLTNSYYYIFDILNLCISKILTFQVTWLSTSTLHTFNLSLQVLIVNYRCLNIIF